MARSHRRSSTRAGIQETRWSGANQSFNALSAGTSALLMISAGSFVTTLMRLRGELVVWKDGASAPGSSFLITIGALVVQEGQGTTVVSSPLTDVEAPWLFYEQVFIGYEEMVVDVIDVPTLTAARKSIDVKAMRILRSGREVQLVVENMTIAGAGSANINLFSRGLFGNH